MVIPRNIEGLISFLIDQKPRKEKDNNTESKEKKEREPYWLIVMITRSIFMVSACAELSYRSPIPITAADWTHRNFMEELMCNICLLIAINQLKWDIAQDDTTEQLIME